MSDLSPEDLIKGWEFQDKIEGMAKTLLIAGIELGVKATTLTLAEQRLQGKLDFDDDSIYDRISEIAYKRAAKKMNEKLNKKEG